MGFSYNHGLVTPLKGAAITAVKVTGLEAGTTPADGSHCVIVQAGAGFVNYVAHTATGIYTVQLNAPYPPHILLCHPKVSAAATTSNILTARYDSATYSATTGQLIINISDDVPIAADGVATDELDILLIFTRYSTLT